MLDGTPTLRMNEFVLGALDKGKIELELSSGKNTAPLQPEELVFTTDSTVEGHVQTAINNFSKVLAEHELIVSFQKIQGKDKLGTDVAEMRDRLPNTMVMVKTP
jgi:carnitine O-acetyltransferase